MCTRFCFCLFTGFILIWKGLCASLFASASWQVSSLSERFCVHPILPVSLEKFHLDMECIVCTSFCGVSLHIFKFLFFMYIKFHAWKGHFQAWNWYIFYKKENWAPGWFYSWAIGLYTMSCMHGILTYEMNWERFIFVHEIFMPWFFLCMNIITWAHTLFFLLPPLLIKCHSGHWMIFFWLTAVCILFYLIGLGIGLFYFCLLTSFISIWKVLCAPCFVTAPQ